MKNLDTVMAMADFPDPVGPSRITNFFPSLYAFRTASIASFCPGRKSSKGKNWSIRFKSYIEVSSDLLDTIEGCVENEEQEDDYLFVEIVEGQKRSECVACGDPVKIVVHSGGKPMAALHCKECYAELRYGKFPKMRRRRML